MKKIIFIVIAIILGLSSCHDDDYITGVPSFGPPEAVSYTHLRAHET